MGIKNLEQKNAERLQWWACQDLNLERAGYEPEALPIELQAHEKWSWLYFYALLAAKSRNFLKSPQ